MARWLELSRWPYQRPGGEEKEKAEKAIQPVEQKAAAAIEEGKVIYKTITRDVVKYVQSPNRTVCKFDDDAVQLRQRAIDAANAIPGFDDGALQSKWRRERQRRRPAGWYRNRSVSAPIAVR